MIDKSFSTFSNPLLILWIWIRFHFFVQFKSVSLISADNNHGTNKSISCCSNRFRCDGLLCTTTAQSNLPIQSPQYILHTYRSGNVHFSIGIFFFKAKSAYEYSNGFYSSVITMTMAVCFTVFFQKIGSIYNLIEKYQEFIEKRKRWTRFLLLENFTYHEQYSLFRRSRIAYFIDIFPFFLFKT